MTFITPILFTVAISVSSVAFSAVADVQDEVLAEVADASTPIISDPDADLNKVIQKYNTTGPGKYFMARKANNEIFYTVANATVMQTGEGSDWVDYRNRAFRQAYIEALAKYLEYRGIDNTATLVRTKFDDKSIPRFRPEELRNVTKMDEVLDKIVALADGKINQQLDELGIDPSEYKALPKQKRKDLLRSCIAETGVTKATDELTGVMPVQTFEASNENGQHVVAVAIVASPKMRQFVDEVKTQRGNIAPNSKKAGGKMLYEVFSNDDQALISAFGIRRMYDKDGYPVLVSFGQSGNTYTGPDYEERLDERETSYEYAKQQAMANFSFLLDSVGSLKIKSEESACKVKNIIVDENGREDRNTSKKIAKKLLKTINMRGKMRSQAGISELYRWTTKDPLYSKEVNGVILTWSPRAERTAYNLKDYKNHANRSSSGTDTQFKGKRGIVIGKEMMDADDF